jgi:hypothetical protein
MLLATNSDYLRLRVGRRGKYSLQSCLVLADLCEEFGDKEQSDFWKWMKRNGYYPDFMDNKYYWYRALSSLTPSCLPNTIFMNLKNDEICLRRYASVEKADDSLFNAWKLLRQKPLPLKTFVDCALNDICYIGTIEEIKRTEDIWYIVHSFDVHKKRLIVRDSDVRIIS